MCLSERKELDIVVSAARVAIYSDILNGISDFACRYSGQLVLVYWGSDLWVGWTHIMHYRYLHDLRWGPPSKTTAPSLVVPPAGSSFRVGWVRVVLVNPLARPGGHVSNQISLRRTAIILSVAGNGSSRPSTLVSTPCSPLQQRTVGSCALHLHRLITIFRQHFHLILASNYLVKMHVQTLV